MTKYLKVYLMIGTVFNIHKSLTILIECVIYDFKIPILHYIILQPEQDHYCHMGFQWFILKAI
ncbi:MAG: hypothetical protein DDT26_02613 [Dehalococcoidia bacterium]|nr:hypothetical protein [Chloroflexota bacterium]